MHDFAHKFNYSPIIRYARLLILKYDLKICSLTDMFSKMQRAKKREVICIMFVWCILLFISNSMSNQWTFILYLSWHIYHTQSQLQWNKVARNNMQIKFLLFSQRSMIISNCKLYFRSSRKVHFVANFIIILLSIQISKFGLFLGILH